MNALGAVVSVGLLVGVGIWGYKLVMRDVTGVPVVRAMQGEMRVAPEAPGGEIAAHTGLAVNAVPGEGGAAAPEDRLVLAPSAPELPQEDLDVAPAAEATEVAPAEQLEEVEVAVAATEAGVVEPTAPLSAADVLALADQIAGTATPLTDLAEGEDVPVATALDGVGVNPDIIPASVPGVARSLRPEARPARAVATATAAPQATAAAAPVEVPALTTGLAAGTKLVQLGAYDSIEVAAQEWARLSTRFPEFLSGKDRVIQQAQSGGRTFYRLRAMGFSDLSDARRFCAAFAAEGPDCIPVVVR